MWGHAVLHAATLIWLRPSLVDIASPQELLLGRVPNVSHLRVFGCHVWVPILEPQRHFHLLKENFLLNKLLQDLHLNRKRHLY